MGLFKRGGAAKAAADSLVQEEANATTSTTPAPPLAAAASSSPARAPPAATATATTPSPSSRPAAAADIEALTTTTPAKTPSPILHRRSAESPLVGGFFHPLRPLGPSHLAEARAHALAARARDPDMAAGLPSSALDADGRRRTQSAIDPPLYEGEHVDAHHTQTRVSRRAEDMLLQRLDDLQHDALAHEPVAEDKTEGKARPWRSALRNLPILLVMAGALAIILVGKSRLHASEALASVHGVTSAEPYFLPLEGPKVDYLYVLTTIAPWYGFLPPGVTAGKEGGGGGHKRRRRALLSLEDGGVVAATTAAATREVEAAGAALRRAWEAVAYDPKAADGDEGWRSAALAALRAGERARELERRGGRDRRAGMAGTVARLLEAGERAEGAAASTAAPAAPPPPSRRRSLLSAPAPAPPSPLAEAARPRLLLQLVQKVKRAPPPSATTNPADLSASELPTAVLGAPAYGFEPVGEPQYCPLKDGASSKCSVSFEHATTGPDAKPGSPLFLSVSLDRPGATAVDIHARELGWLGRAKDWIALAILVVMLVAIASEKLARMYCAVLASFAMLGLLLLLDLAPDLATVMSWLDESTLGLLFGMMLIVGKTAQTGAFEVMTAATLRLSRGSLGLLSVLLLTLTAFLSAWLDNVTTILLVGPITISLLKTMNADPRPLLVAQVLASNIGGSATLVGDPPNIIIGTALSRHIGFVDFLVHMAPGAVLAYLFSVPLILLLYRRSLVGPIPDFDKVLAAADEYKITNWSLFWKCIYVLGIVIVGFLLHPIHHLDPAWFALIGAFVLCISSDRLEVEEIMHLVEWDMLIFFAALFVMVEGAVEVGLIDRIGGFFAAMIRAAPPSARRIVAIEILLWLSAIISALLDNVPFTVAMVPVIEFLAASNLGLPLPLLAWALAFGACLGGNATLIGASANIVGATLLDRSGYPMSFVRWLNGGVPVTVLSVAVANAYMLLRYCLPGSSEYPPTPVV